MKEWLFSKRNIVIFFVVFLLIVALIVMSIIVNDRTYKLSKKKTELANANGTISEYSSEIEEHKKTESELQAEIDKYKAENDSLKKEITELAAKKKAAREAEAAKIAAQNAEAAKKAAAERAQRIESLSNALRLSPITSSPEASMICYLTFDDGPSKNTPAILDILKKYNAKATFFVIGSGNLELLPRIVAEGHTVGLHSNTHIYSGIYSGVDSYLSDLLALSQKVEAKTGKKVNIIRFPGGSSNIVSAKYSAGIMTQLTTLMPSLGYAYFDWNVSSGDADKALATKDEIINGTIARSTGKKSVCLLMHDATAKTTTVEALPMIIERLSAMGYKFETITDTTFGYHQKTNN